MPRPACAGVPVCRPGRGARPVACDIQAEGRRGAGHHLLFLGSTSDDGGGGGGYDDVERSAGAGARDCSDLLEEGHTSSGVYSFTHSSLHRSSYGHDYYSRRVTAPPGQDGQWW